MRTALLLFLALLVLAPVGQANLSQYDNVSTRCYVREVDTRLDVCHASHKGNYHALCHGGVCTIDLHHEAFTRGPWPGGWFVFSYIRFEADGEAEEDLLCTNHRAPAQNARCDRKFPSMTIDIPVDPDNECDIHLRVTTRLEDESHQFLATVLHERTACRTPDGTVYWV